VTVSVSDTTNAPQADLPVYVFNESAYTGFNGKTDAAGHVSLTLPEGSYRFRADLHGAQYWSGTSNHCAAPGCTTASVSVPRYAQVTVTAANRIGEPQRDLPVYAFNGSTYTGLSGVTGRDGKTTLWLPEGNYRFRADQFDMQFWSGQENHCTVPGCTTAVVTVLGLVSPQVTQTITYTYDPLNRLTAADYDTGEYYHYTFDAVGNRLGEQTDRDENTYVYDDANRLINLNGTDYTWDANGNLLDDGTSVYTYNHANRLSTLTQGSDVYGFEYNGLGDRLSQTVNDMTMNYTLDLNSGLTQVLNDGNYDYLYGVSRIAQATPYLTEYYLPDALGSVRQVASSAGKVTLSKRYDPYGEVLDYEGSSNLSFGYAGEMQDSTGMVYLRARYYAPTDGRFVSRDTWEGDVNSPMSYNAWLYTYANPINMTDPSGKFPKYCHKMPNRRQFEDCVRKAYGLDRPMEYDLAQYYNNPESLKDNPGCHYVVSPKLPISYDADGYIEGLGTTWFSKSLNKEIVYDFADMTRARFEGEGNSLSDSLVGIG